MGATKSGREQYRIWVIDALRALGGEASPREVYKWVREHRPVAHEDIVSHEARGEPLYEKELRWARKDLFDRGVIGSPERGRWSII